jgi:hypothetical protein
MSARGKATSVAARLLALALLLGALARLAGPSPQPAPRGQRGVAYLFLSANTDDGLSPAEASRRLRSPGQSRFKQVAGDILRQVGAPGAEVKDAVGDWAGGTENSLLAFVPDAPDFPTVCYAALWFGVLAEQKAVLAFREEPGGADAVVVVDVAERDLARLRGVLDRHAVPFRTLLPTTRGYRVVVYDEGGRLREWLARLGARYASPVAVVPGRGAYLAWPTRGQARQGFVELIAAYESLPGRPKYRPGEPALARR